MIVWASGPTGSGKTTIAGLLRGFGWAVVEEHLPTELFRAFQSNPASNCAALQEHIMRGRHQSWLGVSTARNVIFDRSIDEDARVFCRLHRELGLLDDIEHERLLTLASVLQRSLPNPDIILFLRPPLSILSERVNKGTHPPVIVQTVERQVLLYDAWALARNDALLRIDNSRSSVEIIGRLLREGPPC